MSPVTPTVKSDDGTLMPTLRQSRKKEASISSAKSTIPMCCVVIETPKMPIKGTISIVPPNGNVAA